MSSLISLLIFLVLSGAYLSTRADIPPRPEQKKDTSTMYNDSTSVVDSLEKTNNLLERLIQELEKKPVRTYIRNQLTSNDNNN